MDVDCPLRSKVYHWSNVNGLWTHFTLGLSYNLPINYKVVIWGLSSDIGLSNILHPIHSASGVCFCGLETIHLHPFHLMLHRQDSKIVFDNWHLFFDRFPIIYYTFSIIYYTNNCSSTKFLWHTCGHHTLWLKTTNCWQMFGKLEPGMIIHRDIAS